MKAISDSKASITGKARSWFGFIILVAGGLLLGATNRSAAQEPRLVTLDVPSPLVEVRLMVRAGSAHDPAGKEGLAALTAEALLGASFGDAAHPVTKEQLARITRPWGSSARPRALVEKESTTFVFTVPREVLDEYLEQVMDPMFTQPLFAANEIARLRDEALTNVGSSLRYENLEMVGLEGLENYVFDGTSYAHTVSGSVQGLNAIDADDVRRFHATYYKPGRIILGLSTSDDAVVGPIKEVVMRIGDAAAAVTPFAEAALEAPPRIDGRELTIVAIPDAIASGIHAAFPIDVSRTDPDYWALYVANCYFGTHRDTHSHLSKEIREKRGYNYGNYSYIEYFRGRPFNLFPPFNTPRSFQYFSMWIRPVGAEYSHHLTKAMTWELENLLERGLSREDFELSKNKAKVLYLNLAENSSRLLAARVDDGFYDMEPGYLDSYLSSIEAVTYEQVNAAVSKHLHAKNIKFLITTSAEQAESLAEDIRMNQNAAGRGLADYRIDTDEESGAYIILPEQLDILGRDAVWQNYQLKFDPARVRVIPVESLFETGAFAVQTTALRP